MFNCLNPTNCHTENVDLSTLILVAIAGVAIVAVWKLSNWIDDRFGDGGRKNRPVNPYT